ncbi:hypothetical protein [Streptomyces sp. NPDC050564]|uniref:hypothetical protein n=1 Tax=Streptomyces sp. NPDC050564 TaxID=3365631 RepID=UPI0037AED78B
MDETQVDSSAVLLAVPLPAWLPADDVLGSPRGGGRTRRPGGVRRRGVGVCALEGEELRGAALELLRERAR